MDPARDVLVRCMKCHNCYETTYALWWNRKVSCAHEGCKETRATLVSDPEGLDRPGSPTWTPPAPDPEE